MTRDLMARAKPLLIVLLVGIIAVAGIVAATATPEAAAPKIQKMAVAQHNREVARLAARIENLQDALRFKKQHVNKLQRTTEHLKSQVENALQQVEQLQDKLYTPSTPSTPTASSSSYSGGVLSSSQVASYARGAGFPESVISTMVSIAWRESGFNPRAVNSSSGACGLWQMYPCPGPEALNPATNAAMAFSKYQASGLAPWGY